MSAKVSTGGLVSLFTRHPNAANLLMVLMILAGVYALLKLNTQFFPTVDTKRVTVSVAWSGASAEDVEKGILSVLEPQVRFLDDVKSVVSYAREGSGSINLEYERNADMQQAVSDAETAVAAVTNLPEDSDQPKVTYRSFRDRVAKLSISGPFSEKALRVYAQRIRDDLIARGIDQVTFTGMRDEEMRIEIPERELRRLDLTVSDVAGRVSRSTRDMPSGSLDGNVEMQLRALAADETPSAIGEIDVKTFSSGERVQLTDIGTVKWALDPNQVRSLVAGEPAIEITVSRAPSADTLKTSAILDTYLEDSTAFFPSTLKIEKYQVRADRVLERIMLLVKNGASGLFLVVLILIIFLNFRIAFWVAAGIPVAVMATLGMMLVTGQSINMISLFALIMMLGIIVDDAIVVGEHTATRSEMGDGAYDAAENGAGRMITPVMAASLTTMAAFAPIFLIRDVMGQIMFALPMVVLAVLVASIIECFFVLPGHLAHSLKADRRARWSWWRVVFVSLAVASFVIIFSRIHASIDQDYSQSDLWTRSVVAIADWVNGLQEFASTLPFGATQIGQSAYMTFCFLLAACLFEALFYVLRSRNETVDGVQQDGPLRRGFDRGFAYVRDKPFSWLVWMTYKGRYVTLAIAAASVMVLVVGLIRGGHVKMVFFPSPEAENIAASVSFNAGIPEAEAIDALKRIGEALKAAEKKISPDGELLVTHVLATLGQSGFNRGDNVARVNVQLTSSEERTVRTPDIVKAWRRAVPAIVGVKRLAIFELRGGPPGRDIDIRLQNGPPATLKAAALEASDLLAGFPGVSGVADDLPYGKPELVMRLKPRGAALGFTIDAVGRQIRDAFEGAIARRLAIGENDVAVRIVATQTRSGSQKLRNMELRAPNGRFVPLSEIVDLQERQGFSVIQRREGKTTVSVTSDVNHKVMVADDILAELSEPDAMPTIASKYGIDYEFSGRNEERGKAFADLQTGVMIALAVIYIILAWVFASYVRPFAVMLIIPLGAVGAIVGHWFMGMELTILSWIGLLGLAGILVNDSIILVSRMDERLENGEPLDVAAMGASKDRFRAVLLTSLTTVAGLTPLLWEQSLQAEFLKPMAITIVFGLVVATVWVLFLVPALVGIGNDINLVVRAAFGRLRQRQVAQAEGQAL